MSSNFFGLFGTWKEGGLGWDDRERSGVGGGVRALRRNLGSSSDSGIWHCSATGMWRGMRWWSYWLGLSPTWFEFLFGRNSSRWGDPHPPANLSSQPGSSSWACRVNYQRDPCVTSSAMKSNLFPEEWSIPRAAQTLNNGVAAKRPPPVTSHSG